MAPPLQIWLYCRLSLSRVRFALQLKGCFSYCSLIAPIAIQSHIPLHPIP